MFAALANDGAKRRVLVSAVNRETRELLGE